jgi:HK97 family phage prohead protease
MKAPRPLVSPKLRAVRFKAESIAADGTFEGYGNVFNVIDSYGDVVLPGAFAESLAGHQAAGTMPKMLLQHDPAVPIGRWLEMREDAHGLFCKGHLILDVAAARETHALMKAGALDALSIGGEPLDTEQAFVDELAGLGIALKDGGNEAPNGQVRLVHTWHLWETSVVTFPACAPALIDTATVKRRPARRAIDPREAAQILALKRQVAANARHLAALQSRRFH